MEVVTIEQAAEEAKVEWKQYCKAIRENIPNDAEYMKYYKSIKNALYYLSKGKHILDLYASMKAAGVNEQGQPKLAICKATMREVCFQKDYSDGPMFFEKYLPEGKTWEEMRNRFKIPSKVLSGTKHSTIKTIVPKVPAQFIPKNGLKGYYILWEVEEWTPEPPVDPILLKRIRGSKNLFAVMAVWNLTELERAVLRGAVM